MKAVTRRELMDMLVPMAGAVLGGAGCSFVAERLNLRKEAVALGALTGGLAIAGHTRGLAQQLATGVAAAGASVLAMEILARLRPDWTLFAARRQPPATQAVTRRELQDALARTEAKRNNGADTSKMPANEPAQDRVEAVLSRLSSEERIALEDLHSKSPALVIMQVEQQLRSLSTEEGVAFLRLHVLPHASPRAY
jgi:hypothetical protein